MSTTNSMTREELLDYAALDAFGLLDEYETALYTRSFHNAPAAIQDRIVEIQAQLVSDESLLPTDSPDPVLRQKVLIAVASAIEQETAQLEPLATIGRNRPVAPDVVGRIGLGFTGQVWRAATFALCASLIVIAYFMAQLSSQHSRIAEIALLRNTDAQLEELIGPTLKEYLFEANQGKVVFKAVDPSASHRAALFMIEGTDKAFLVVEGLALAAEPYTLVIRDQNGQTEQLRTFESNGALMGMHVAIKDVASRLQNATWQITTSRGDVLLASI